MSRRNLLRWLAAAVFWLAVWQGVAMLVGREVLLAPPLRVAERLWALAQTAEFWRTTAYTLMRIVSGYLMAAAAGILLASLSAFNGAAEALIRPLVSLVKSMPVASFTIMALIWVKAAYLSVLVSFMMALPIFYFSMLEGLRRVDPKLLDMARLFRVPPLRRAGMIYARSALPYVLPAVSGAMGIAWKSGVAAEVIGLPSGSIGLRLQQAKLFLETADLFAWTAVIVALSALMETLLRRTFFFYEKEKGTKKKRISGTAGRIGGDTI